MRSLFLGALLIAGLCGCSIPGIDPPAATVHPFALTEKFTAAQTAGNDELKKISTVSAASDERLSRIEAGVTATNAHLSDMVTHFRQTQGQNGELLQAVERLRESVESQASKTPPLRAAAAAEELFPDDLLILVEGQMVPMRGFVDQWYKQPWRELTGSIDACLSRFGIAAEYLQQLSSEAKERLHGAIHEHEQSTQTPRNQPPPAKPLNWNNVVTQPPAANPCPGGVCQQPAQQWQFSTRRSRRR